MLRKDEQDAQEMKNAETIVFRTSYKTRIGARFLQGPMNVRIGRRAVAGHSSEAQGCQHKELMFRDLSPRDSWSDHLSDSRSPAEATLQHSVDEEEQAYSMAKYGPPNGLPTRNPVLAFQADLVGIYMNRHVCPGEMNKFCR